MDILLLVLALLCNTSLALLDKASGNLIKKDEVLSFSFYKTLLCAIFAVLLLPFGEHYISSVGVLVSVGAGLFHALSVVLIMHSLRKNPAVYVNLFMASGILLPTVCDWIFVYGKVNIIEFLLLVCVIASLSLVLNLKKGKSNIGLLCLMFLCYGMLMVMQGVYPKVCDGSRVLFSVIMYGSSSLMLGSICFLGKKRAYIPQKLKMFGAVAAVLNLAINILLTTLSAALPSSAVFPAVHGLKLVAVTLLSPFLWSERLNAKQIVGAFLTIILVCII
ncbi:MAG: hypothetical protein E7613_02585 [Ruminococcaceae bacterium]|nr:hypothetical protein [Oscillospiraceae bacterium]